MNLKQLIKWDSPCIPSLQQRITHLLSLLQTTKCFIGKSKFHNLNFVHLLIGEGCCLTHFYKKGTSEIPLRLTPRCFSNASSISLEPRIIQGVVPQTKRWYLPTWKEIKNFTSQGKAARRQMTYVYPKLTHGLTNHLWSVEHGVEGCNLVYTNGSNFNNLSHLRHPKKYKNMTIHRNFGTNHLDKNIYHL